MNYGLRNSPTKAANFGRAGSVRQVAPDPAKPDEELIHVQLDGDAPGELTAFRAEQLTVL